MKLNSNCKITMEYCKNISKKGRYMYIIHAKVTDERVTMKPVNTNLSEFQIIDGHLQKDQRKHEKEEIYVRKQLTKLTNRATLEQLNDVVSESDDDLQTISEHSESFNNEDTDFDISGVNSPSVSEYSDFTGRDGDVDSVASTPRIHQQEKNNRTSVKENIVVPEKKRDVKSGPKSIKKLPKLQEDKVKDILVSSDQELDDLVTANAAYVHEDTLELLVANQNLGGMPIRTEELVNNNTSEKLQLKKSTNLVNNNNIKGLEELTADDVVISRRAKSRKGQDNNAVVEEIIRPQNVAKVKSQPSYAFSDTRRNDEVFGNSVSVSKSDEKAVTVEVVDGGLKSPDVIVEKFVSSDSDVTLDGSLQLDSREDSIAMNNRRDQTDGFDFFQGHRTPLPDFSVSESETDGRLDIDPDLISLSGREDTTVGRLDTDDNRSDVTFGSQVESQWFFRDRKISAYDNAGNKRMGRENERPVVMLVPEAASVPKVGDK